MNESWGTLWQNYPNAWWPLGVAFLSTTVFTAGLYMAAQKRHLLPSIRARDVHTVRKPRVGGIAMWLAIIVSFAWIVLLQPNTGPLTFGRDVLFGLDKALMGIMLGMLILLLMGLADDLRGLHWSWQLGGQLAAALALVWAGITVSFIRLPFDSAVSFAPVWSGVFTVVWVVAVINVMNWFDGLDGLAGSVATVAAMALFFVSMQVGVPGTATLSLIVAGATAGFLVWNWHPSKLFMGTVGSQLLGFLLAIIAIISGGKLATAVLVLGIPLLDALIVVGRRLVAGKSPFVADQRHLHHRLLKIGLPVPWVVILINAVTILFGALAVSTRETNTKGFLIILVVLCMVLFILATYALERRVRKK